MMFGFLSNLSLLCHRMAVQNSGLIMTHRIISCRNYALKSLVQTLKCNILHHNLWTSQIRLKSSKDNPYPPLNEDELEESFIHGSGPGGQNVNKLSNCVQLRHIPTGVTIKCHEHRLLPKNRITARLRLQERLDWFYNRENSIKEQQKREGSKKKQAMTNKNKKRLEMKKAFKEREGLD